MPAVAPVPAFVLSEAFELEAAAAVEVEPDFVLVVELLFEDELAADELLAAEDVPLVVEDVGAVLLESPELSAPL